jgi:hypothetical protein
MKMEQTECSETLAFKLQTPGNNPEESIRHSKHKKSLKSKIFGCPKEVVARDWKTLHDAELNS